MTADVNQAAREIRKMIVRAVEARVPAHDITIGKEAVWIECKACPGSRFDPFDLPAPEKGGDTIKAMFEWIDGWIVAHESCEVPQ